MGGFYSSRVSEEQGGYRKGRGCVDQIFTKKLVVEKYVRKGGKLYAAFMDLEKAYDKVNRRAIKEILMIQGVGGHLLD